MKTKLAEAVRAARLKLGLTQTQLAGLVGLHPNAIVRWEGGVGVPAKRNRARILAAVNTVNAEAGRTLSAAFAEAFPPKRRPGQPAPVAPPPPPAAPVYETSVWVTQAAYRVAEHLDVSPRRARGAALRMLRLLAKGHVTVEQAVAELEKPEVDRDPL